MKFILLAIIVVTEIFIFSEATGHGHGKVSKDGALTHKGGHVQAKVKGMAHRENVMHKIATKIHGGATHNSIISSMAASEKAAKCCECRCRLGKAHSSRWKRSRTMCADCGTNYDDADDESCPNCGSTRTDHDTDPEVDAQEERDDREEAEREPEQIVPDMPR